MADHGYFDSEETIGFPLLDRAMRRGFFDRIALHGVASGRQSFLRVLWEKDGLTRLEPRARMKGSTTVTALNKLENKDFVHREINRTDGRKVNVFPPPAGRHMHRRVTPDVETANCVLLIRLSPDKQAAALVRRVRNAVTVA